MTRYVALLRAVNVGGTGKLAMSDLKAMCSDAGYARVETYIASGNVVFETRASPAKIKAELEQRLRAHMGKPVGVFVRSAAELAAILSANPFSDTDPKRTYVLFIEGAVQPDPMEGVSGRTNEQLHAGAREIFIHYPDGQGRSKLKIPAAATGTARNMNTIAKLVEIASQE